MAGSIAQSVLTVRSTGATASLLLHKRSTVSKPPPLPGLARIPNSTTRSVTPALSHAVRFSSSTRINQVRCRVNRSGSAYSPLNSESNFSDLPPTEMAPLFPGCDYERWLVLMDKPGGEGATKQQMIDCYIQTLAKVVGSEEEAKKRIYNVSSEMYFGFVCEIDEETSNNLEGLPGVLCVLPDSYVDPENKDCGGIQEQRHLIGLSSRPLASHDGFHLGCFPHKHPIQRKSKYGLPHETVFGSRTHQYPTLGSSNHKGEFCGTFNGSGSCRRGKFSRDVVVRSELTSAGSTGASYPLLEIWLNSKVRGICFYAVTACAAIILFVPMLLEHPFVLMFDRYRRQAHYLVAKTWAFLTVAPFVKIEYEGLENLPPTNTPAVYVANHQSFLDIYTLLTLGRSFKFISKTSIFLYPIIGWAMFLLGVIPLKRMDSRSQLDCLKQCMALIKKGASVFFFPEGTRSKDGKLGPFKKGAFSVAAKTGVPVIPITLIGTGEIMPAGMEGRLNPGSVKVIIHPSLVGNKPDALCNEARNIIAQDLIHQS